MSAKFKILIVDDEPDKRALLTVAMQMAGYDVLTANDGESALAIIESNYPDLIITDTMMPKLDGYELARRVRANPQTRFIPVIIQTAARNNAESVRYGSEVGALGYITDPTDIDLLLARARTLLDFKEYLDTLEELAFTDHLTGLANRRRFESRLKHEVARTLYTGRPFCLLLLDIDHFKKVNDAFGHDVGDETIRRLAKVLKVGIRTVMRKIDMAARVGGEEFGIILPELDLSAGLEVATRLRDEIAALEIPKVGGITSSFGLAEFPSCATDELGLYKSADSALYLAKQRGRNRVEYSEPLG